MDPLTRLEMVYLRRYRFSKLAGNGIQFATEYTNFNGQTPIGARALFSPEFDRIVATNVQTQEAGSLVGDLGWLTSVPDSNYKSVLLLDDDGDDFGDVAYNDTPAFSPNGDFPFARREPSRNSTKNPPPPQLMSLSLRWRCHCQAGERLVMPDGLDDSVATDEPSGVHFAPFILTEGGGSIGASDPLRRERDGRMPW